MDALKIEHTKTRLQANDADLSGSIFTDVKLSGAVFEDVNLAEGRLQNVNLSGLRIANANLRGASIVDSMTDGMTINGIPLADLIAAYGLPSQKERLSPPRSPENFGCGSPPTPRRYAYFYDGTQSADPTGADANG